MIRNLNIKVKTKSIDTYNNIVKSQTLFSNRTIYKVHTIEISYEVL